MKASYSSSNDSITLVRDDGSKICLSSEEVSAMALAKDMEQWKQDVQAYFDKKVEEGELSKDVAEDPDFFDDFLEEYTENMKNIGLWNYEVYLDAAMERMELSDYGDSKGI